MCKNVLFGNKCPKSDCEYAHSLKQLVVNDCRYKDRCDYIIKNKKTYTNNKDKRPCSYIHPEEDIKDYYFRVGLGRFLKKN